MSPNYNVITLSKALQSMQKRSLPSGFSRAVDKECWSHRFLLHSCPNEGPCLHDGKAIPDLGYADDFVLLATTAMGLQRLLDAVAKFCTRMGMVIHIHKTKVIAFGHLYPVPFQWTINGETLETVLQIKYLGVIFTAHAGLSLTFGPLKTKMCAA